MYVLKVFLVYSHLLVTSTGPNIICQKEPSLQKNIGIISKKEAAGHEWLQMSEPSRHWEYWGRAACWNVSSPTARNNFFLI